MTHSHTGWIVSRFNQISQVCHRTHKHNLRHHTIHKYLLIKTQCVPVSQHVRFARLYFSVLNRFISAIRMNKWPTVLFRLIRVNKCSTDQFLSLQKLLKLTSPHITTTKLSLWLVEQNVSTIKKFSQDITSFTIGCLSFLSRMFCVCICVHALCLSHYFTNWYQQKYNLIPSTTQQRIWYLNFA
jgi:hypothetical protein